MAGMQPSAPKPLHIFKPGRHTTVAGEAIEFSEADLAATAAAYSKDKHRAPIVKGHPAMDAPAQGWADGLVMRERGLYALPSKVDPAFAEEVRAGRWGAVSAKFYRPDAANNPVPGVWYLRHIGVLGAQPPAVKGLDSPEFSEVEDGCVCFAEGVAFGEWDAMTSANLWRQMRDWIVAKFGLEEADKVLPNYDVRALELGTQEDIATQRAATPTAFSEGDPAATQPPPKESTVTEQEAAQLREQNAALQARLDASDRAQAERDQRDAAAATAARTAEHTAFAEGLISEGKVIEADKALVVAFADAMHPAEGEPVMFGEGDDKALLVDQFKAFLQRLPAGVEFGEHATRTRAGTAGAAADVEYAEGTDQERIDLDQKVRRYADEHKVSYSAAYAAVTK